jgi:LmbE family N-acetylglucosaminyl deacetylase
VYVWCWDPEQADHFVDIAATLEAKITALRCHASQITEDPAPLLTGWAARHGTAAGFTHAEGFRVTDLSQPGLPRRERATAPRAGGKAGWARWGTCSWPRRRSARCAPHSRRRT